ncbi:proteasomal ubiquitin receptor ADRM1-like isoform X1 [Dreissena polymorpha]|uniref:proteasomal ubiquitin receptor ADRM1-like isoform X1 n=1 Tax=Dreissena polymorpha TaxID=45954 RepID=UPI002263D3F9|nr:proteasomal ubiquitin receptor ADRM1-like isoform X1 [Dreissena polymorpha]XP_052228284.1 proteasomal ubiquitin receptor ADRM1-like isoform X1 [Dreissena polymorpha]
MSGALFGNTSGRSQSKNLVEFRAGKMHMKGKMVHADKRKGLVYVHQSDDSLMHFCWKDRTTGSVEDDLIIFPDDIEFKHVKQCTTGRVFVLKFKSSTRKFFFWMQEPKSDKDEEYSKKVNEYLNNPPTPGSNRGGEGSLPSDLANLAGDSDIQSILGGMSQQQLMQLLGGMGGPGGGLSALMGRPGSAQSTASEPPLRVQSSPGTRSAASETPTQPRPVTAVALPSHGTTTTSAGTAGGTTTTTPAGRGTRASAAGGKPAIQLSDLQNILSNMNVPADKDVDLSKALDPESMVPILANPEVQQRLIPFLPEGGALPKSEEELRATITSPQFKQALSSFSSALQSGQLGPLMSQFGLGEDVANAAAQGDIEAFVKAMQANKKSKDKDEPEDMDQD